MGRALSLRFSSKGNDAHSHTGVCRNFHTFKVIILWLGCCLFLTKKAAAINTWKPGPNSLHPWVMDYETQSFSAHISAHRTARDSSSGTQGTVLALKNPLSATLHSHCLALFWYLFSKLTDGLSMAGPWTHSGYSSESSLRDTKENFCEVKSFSHQAS